MAILGFKHDVTALLEKLPNQSPKRILIFDQEHRFRSPRNLLCPCVCFNSCRWFRYAREIDGECCPLANLAGYKNISATLFYNPIYRSQTETGAFSLLFGREERLEDIFQRLRVYSGSRVGYRQHDMRATFVSGFGAVRAKFRIKFSVTCLDDEFPAV